MTNISKAVQTAIETELPSVVAGELQAYLKEAEQQRLKLEKLEKENEELQGKLRAEYEARLFSQEELKKEQALNVRKEELDEQERNMKVVVADLKASEADRRADGLYALIDRIFKNPVVVKSITNSTPVAVNSSAGIGSSGYVSNYSGSENTTETID